MLKNKLYLLIFLSILLIACFLRLWKIGIVPYGVTNDEVSYIYSAYTIWETGGYDLENKFLPLSVNVEGNDLSPVPVYVIAPFVGMLGVSPITGRLPFALAGIASVILIYGITQKLWNNQFVSFASMFSMSISSWHLLVGRGAYDSILALFFFLLSLYILLIKVGKGNINWVLPLLFLSFYSYHATKIFIVLFIFVSLVFYHKVLWKRKKEFATFIFGSILLVLSFLYVLSNQGVIRQNILIWKDPKTVEQISKEVGYQREKSSAPPQLSTFYSNKVVYLADKFISNYLTAFSPQFLFTEGDPIYLNGYNIFFRGVMYIYELPLLLLGLLFLIKQGNKRSTLFTFALLLFAPLPSAIAANRSYVIRSLMMLPFLSMIVGCGIYYLFKLTMQYKLLIRIGMFSLFIGILTVFFSEYFYNYYFQFASFGSESWSKSTREISEYIYENSKKYKNIYLVNNEKVFRLNYAVVNNISPTIIKKSWQNNEEFKLNNLTVIKDCFNNGIGTPQDFLKAHTLYIVPAHCHPDGAPLKTIFDPIEPQRIIFKVYEKK